jgi:peptidoglycan hydrolase CwlO-like protein
MTFMKQAAGASPMRTGRLFTFAAAWLTVGLMAAGPSGSVHAADLSDRLKKVDARLAAVQEQLGQAVNQVEQDKLLRRLGAPEAKMARVLKKLAKRSKKPVASKPALQVASQPTPPAAPQRAPRAAAPSPFQPVEQTVRTVRQAAGQGVDATKLIKERSDITEYIAGAPGYPYQTTPGDTSTEVTMKS